MELRPYQVAGKAFLASRSGALLGDWVGLGKTIQAITAVQATPDCTAVLVICPLKLKLWWEQQICEHELAAGAAMTRRQDVFKKTPGIEIFDANGERIRSWVIAHPEHLSGRSEKGSDGRRHKAEHPVFPLLMKAQWDAIVVDEVHKFKRRDAHRTANLWKLKAQYKWGLSGTMVPEFPQDLWALLHWVAPQKFASYWNFEQRFVRFDVDYHGYRKIVGARNLPELRRLCEPYLLIRSREDVGLELPPLTITDVPLLPEDDQLELYNKVRKESLIALEKDLPQGEIDFTDLPAIVITNAMARFTRLHEVASSPSRFKWQCSSAKLDWLEEQIEAGIGPCLVFSRYNHTVDEIEQTLKRLGAKGWMVGTYDGLAEGLNLQKYHTIIAWDCTFKAAQWTQAVGRAHRMGQDKSVQVYRLSLAGMLVRSVDERIISMVDRKRAIVETVLEWLREEQDRRNN